MFFKLAASLATVLLIGSTAAASTITVDTQHNRNIFKDEDGKNRWYVPTTVSVGSYNSNWLGAGAFRLKDTSDTIEDFIAFCLEPLLPMKTPTSYEIGSLFSADITRNLQVLAGNAMELVTDKRTAAAFQMAAWEITTETAASYDVDGGFFQITADTRRSNKAEALAQTWLTNIETDVWSAPSKDFLILNAQGNQDLMTNIQPMPIPASGLMLLGSLGAGAYMARRKKV